MSVSVPSPPRRLWSLAPRSLRWRLQIWHAVMLVAILGLFGSYVYHLQWQTRMQQTDSELTSTADIIKSRLRRLFVPTPRPPQEGVAGGPPPPRDRDRSPGDRSSDEKRGGEGGERRGRPSGEGREGERREENDRRDNDRRPGPGWPWPWQLGSVGLPEDLLTSNESRSPMYFLIWDKDGRLLEKSALAADIEFPGLRNPADGFPIRTLRTRGMFREVILVSNFDFNVLVGRSLELDLATHQRQGFVLIGSGCVVLLVGLAGGWGFTSRILRPIHDMSETAASISENNLSRRIGTEAADTELGELAQVLNETFDRLQSAFNRQTQFTADASHELRTPVSVILAQTQSSLLKPRSPEEYREALQACRRASLRMKGLIDSLLALARLDAAAEAPALRALDLDELIRETATLLGPTTAEKGIAIQLQLVPCRLSGDKNRLDQLLTNLLSNAVRYNRVGGRVLVTLVQDGDQAVVTVRDTGEGIPAESIPRLFDRFYRVDPARSRQDGGSGLGLSISKAVVEAHGGSIRIDSEVGVGTTVTLRLPGVERETRSEPPEIRSAPPAPLAESSAT